MKTSLIAACLLLVAACGKRAPHPARNTPPAPPAFWVWHRSSALKPAEEAALKQAGIRTLYWQVAECAWLNGGWNLVRTSSPLARTAELQVIPVYRIQAQPAFLKAPGAAGLLAEQIRKGTDGAAPSAEIQLDFDCPDSMLGGYAKFLKSLGEQVAPTRISITALAGWPRRPEFGELARSVCLLAPMFYDLEADEPAQVLADRLHPMADPSVTDLIRLWADCPRPWLAGLPNFERLSVFKANGNLTGHLRGWEPDPVFFHPNLLARSMDDGVTLFEVKAPVVLSGTRIQPGDLLVHRTPDARVLAMLASAARDAGASGMVYFALPGPGMQAAFSPAHLVYQANSTRPQPVLALGKNNTLVLHNPGPADLPTRNWELSIHSDQSGAFQSASPGGFAEMEDAEGVPAELAGTLVLRFSRLSAGQSLVSGPVIHNPAGLTWQIRNLTEKQALDSANSAR